VTGTEVTSGLPPDERKAGLPIGGRLLALAAAAALGGTTPFARLTYDAGTSPITLLVVRFAVASLVFGAFLWATRKPLWPTRPDTPAFLIAGLALTGLTIDYLLSIAYIPVGLAALLLYTFPLIVLITAPFIEASRLRTTQVLAFFAAFLGLAAALGPDVANLDPLGIALALGAALCMALLLFQVRHLTRRHDPVTILLNGNLVGLILVGSVMVVLEPPLLAASFLGIFALAVAAGLYVVGIGLSFLAVRAVGSADTALFLNLEPVMAIALAMLLLGEHLTLAQVGGGLLVLSALYVAGRPIRRV